MAWYWWILAGVVAYLGIRAAFRGGQRRSDPEPARDDFAFIRKVRERDAAVDRALARVVEMLLELPVVSPNPAYGSTLPREAIGSSISSFMQSAGRTGAATSTKMLQVVVSPIGLTAFVKLAPTEPAAAMREFIRVADGTWAYRTNPVDDMDEAVLDAERMAARIEAEAMALVGVDELGRQGRV